MVLNTKTMSLKWKKDNYKEDSKAAPKSEAENTKIKEIDKIYERKANENRALEKIIREIKNVTIAGGENPIFLNSYYVLLIKITSKLIYTKTILKTNIMKKTISFLLTAVLLATIISCQNSAEQTKSSEKPTTVEVTPLVYKVLTA